MIDSKWTKKIEEEISKYQKLEKALYEIHKAEMDTYKKRLAAFQEIDSVKESEDDNKNLSNIYIQFTKTMKEIEEKKKNQLNYLNTDLLPVTTYYYKDQLKNTKKNLDNLLKLRKHKIKIENESKKALDKNDQNKASEMNKEKAKNESEERKQTQDFESELCKFEAERTTDNKNLFLHLILSELEYHAYSLEKISKLFQDINKIEPQENLKEFKSKYNINCSLSNIGVDEDEIERRRKQKEFEERNKKDFEKKQVFNE